jgi:hypothetical protein
MRKSVVAIAMALLAGTAFGQALIPLGDQFQVNTYTTGDQTTPEVATAASGDYVVVWSTTKSPGPDLSSSSVWGRLYAASGEPLTDEFQVNTYSFGAQISPAVAMHPDGEFVIAWGSSASAGGDSFYSIQGQRFAADGTPVGGEFQVNTYTTNVQEAPAVAMADDGGFLVAWQSVGSFGGDTSARSIQARLYSSDGVASGPELQVNTFSLSDQAEASVGLLPRSGFVISWFSVGGSGGTDTSGRSIQAQVLDDKGGLVGGEFQVNSYTTGNQYNSSVAVADDGDFVVVWSGNGSFGDDTDYAVLGQRFDRDGLAVGDEFQVNTYTTSTQCLPEVAGAANGDFVVVWRSGGYVDPGPDGDGLSIAAQAFTPDGTFDGDEQVANSYTTSHQSAPTVASATGQRYVMAWQSDGSPGDDTAGDSAQARSFAAARLFVDGFESGDIGAWSGSGD